jgi:hypothetical protein
MRIRFLKTITVDVEKPRIHETWDKTFNRWAELQVEEVFLSGKVATLKTYDGDLLLNVPADAFEKMEEKRTVML